VILDKHSILSGSIDRVAHNSEILFDDDVSEINARVLEVF
jgi:hypothetical protein